MIASHLRADRIMRTGVVEPFAAQRFQPTASAQGWAKLFTNIFGPSVAKAAAKVAAVQAAGGAAQVTDPKTGETVVAPPGSAMAGTSWLAKVVNKARSMLSGARLAGFAGPQDIAARQWNPGSFPMTQTSQGYPGPDNIRVGNHPYGIAFQRQAQAANAIIGNMPGLQQDLANRRMEQYQMETGVGYFQKKVRGLSRQAVRGVDRMAGIRGQTAALREFYRTRAGY